MYHEVKLDSLSKKQVSKLLNGHPVRVKMGGAIPAFVSVEHLKKLTKAGMKGSGVNLTLDPYAIAKNQHLRKAVGMLMGRGKGHKLAGVLADSAGRSAVAATDRLVRALEGSGKGHKLAGVLADSAGRSAIAATDRLVRSLEGSGKGHELAGVLSDSAGRSAIAATDRLVRSLEGSGPKKRGRPKKIGGDGRGFGQARAQQELRQSYPPTPGMSGRGKKSSTEQFRDWTKNIGQVFKPLNRGALGAAKRQVIGAAGNAISDEISNQGNPYIDGAELFSQGIAGMDGNPSTQGINLGSDVPVQQTRYQMRKAKIAARPVGVTPLPYSPYMGEPVYATPIRQSKASPAASVSLGLPALPDGAYEDSYSIPTGELYGVGVKVKKVKIEGKVKKPKRVMSEAQKAALAKGRHALRLKLNQMGAGCGGAAVPAGY